MIRFGIRPDGRTEGYCSQEVKVGSRHYANSKGGEQRFLVLTAEVKDKEAMCDNSSRGNKSNSSIHLLVKT